MINHAMPGRNLTDKYPELGKGPVSTVPYCDQSFFETFAEHLLCSIL